jgi:16S rRNA (adenine1518-N6/adenine1519-N6)-dimethyltransferase
MALRGLVVLRPLQLLFNLPNLVIYCHACSLQLLFIYSLFLIITMKKEDHHFMKDQRVLERIAAAVPSGGTVLEIGAGRGELTGLLLERTGNVIAIEKEKELFSFLKKRFGKNRKIKLIHGNALKEIEWLDFEIIVSNLPYSICEPLFRMLPSLEFMEGFFTLPRGFYQKLAAPPYSLLFSATILFKIPKNAFDPPPRTESVFVRVIPRNGLFRLVFQMQKNKLKNALREALVRHKGFTKNQAREALKTLKLNSLWNKRVCDLTPGDFLVVEKALQASLLGMARPKK